MPLFPSTLIILVVIDFIIYIALCSARLEESFAAALELFSGFLLFKNHKMAMLQKGLERCVVAIEFFVPPGFG